MTKYKYLVTRVRDGTTKYFFNLGGEPRKEKPLGCDYKKAIEQWKILFAKKLKTNQLMQEKLNTHRPELR